MPKPFSLQAPEAIAKEYGGNKQKIAQAMQTGLVDPTAGTLAGMFIDRMRSAQMQEGAQQPSVAQQVFAPPAPPAPPMGGMGPPPGAPPMGAPPMGMADGGLAMLPVPDNMFDEPMDGEYANGGIVSFAAGTPGTVKAADDSKDMFGYTPDPMALVEEYRRLYKPKTEAAERARKLYEESMSEEALKQRRDEDKYFALAQLGATMTSTPGSLLQAFGAGVGKALPGLQESSRERRAEQREAIKQLALDEGASNAEARREADLYMQGKGKYAELAQAEKTRREDREFQREKLQTESALTREQIKATKAAAGARNQPDFMDRAVAARFSALKEANARRDLPKPGEKFNRNIHRLSDATLVNLAYQQVMGQRYFDPATNPLTQNRAAAIGQVLGASGGGAGQDTVDLGPIKLS